MHKTDYIDLWRQEIASRAESGELHNAIAVAFGNQEGEDLDAIYQLTVDLASDLPTVEVLDIADLRGHISAYRSDTDTILISQQALADSSIAIEALTHELGHAIAYRYFSTDVGGEVAYDFTKALMGQDHALILSANAVHADHPQDQAADSDQTLTLQGEETPFAVEWFETVLHIDWAREQLPMLNAQAFDLLKLGQNDSDAFWGPVRAGIFSPYGLQTDSSTHFDNNNVRGSVEAMRKRWSNGMEKFGDTSIEGKLNLPFVDKALVGPGFDGPHAGIENLLYRFGQITHAFQDFYSHSNWIEMVNGTGQWIESGTLLDSSLDLPDQLNPGSRLSHVPNMAVAMSGPDYDASLIRAGVSWFNWIYWRVEDRQNGWGEAFAELKSGSQVGGLMTGTVNRAIYYDTDYRVPLVSVAGKHFFSHIEPTKYLGFSHGGLAGAVLGSWMSPLSKDKEL